MPSSNGRQLGEATLKTVGQPARLALKADRPALRRSRSDLSFVTVEIQDQAGELVPDAVVPVAISVSGAGELAAAGTANPKDVFSFRRANPKTFHGRCLAIVRPTGAAGTITLRAQADGLASASVTLQVK